MSLRALLFDVDGTLADTEDAHRAAFNAAFARFGYDWQWGRLLYRELLRVTGGKERIRHYLERFQPSALAEAGTPQRIAEIHAVKTEIYVEGLRSGRVRLRRGIARIINEARAAGVLLAIASTATADNVYALLEANLGPESPGWFADIAAGDCVPAKKPAPDVYQLVLQHLGLPAADCLAIEDSFPGFKSARAAGVPVVMILNDYTTGPTFKGALAVLNGFGDPGEPLAPPVEGHGWVDLAMLRAWHAKAGQP